jgi:hypothetical protein
VSRGSAWPGSVHEEHGDGGTRVDHELPCVSEYLKKSGHRPAYDDRQCHEEWPMRNPSRRLRMREPGHARCSLTATSLEEANVVPLHACSAIGEVPNNERA